MTPDFDEAWFAARASTGVRGLRAYDPGHDVVALRAQHGLALVELGSNENPYGPSPRARAAMLDELHLAHRYPDPRGAGLKAALATLHGVSPDAILLGNGSHEILMQVAQVFSGPGLRVAYPRYGFAVFALAAQAAGAAAVVCDALDDDAAMPLGHDLAALRAAIDRDTRLVYLANPNNPTGTWIDGDALESFLRDVPADVIVVVDEAYAEMADAPGFRSMLRCVARHPNLVVTRTFSKAYGLAGLRCGYAVAAEGLVAVMERIRESFNVNAFALAACTAAIGHREHLDWVRARNAEQRRWLADRLTDRGVRVLPSQTNFLLARSGPRTPRIEADLLERGVILRPMRGYGLPEYTRITVGSVDENRLLLRALDEVLA